MNQLHAAPKAKVRPNQIRQPVERIRPEGLYRWDEFSDRIPFSRETWRQRMKAGLAPKPKSSGVNSAYWKGEDLLLWLNDPDGYTATGPTN